MNIKVAQIYYDKETEKFLDEAYIPYNNESFSDEYFESGAIVRMFDEGLPEDSKFFGAVSWNIKDKALSISNGNYIDGQRLMKTIVYNSAIYDVFAINYDKANHNPIVSSPHPELLEIADIVFSKFGKFNIRNIYCESSIYMNHFIARTEIYRAFVRSWLEPIVEILKDKKDTSLQSLLWRDSGYKGYSLHPFFCERMFTIFCAVLPKRLKIFYI